MDEELTWQRIEVDGRTASFGVGGSGPPVVFLHGWALGSRAYRRPMRRLIRRGCQVFAPAVPGLGGTADLPTEASDWLAGQGVSIESLDASTTEGIAHDVFLVSGDVTASDLSRHLARGAGATASATRDGPGPVGCVRTRRG